MLYVSDNYTGVFDTLNSLVNLQITKRNDVAHSLKTCHKSCICYCKLSLSNEHTQICKYLLDNRIIKIFLDEQ